jgi:competence ComEA-like helix-hairpin-helix protein
MTKQPDRRMLAAMFIAVCILFFATAKARRGERECPDEFHDMALWYGRFGLEWTRNAEDRLTKMQKIPAELTPFFFEPVRVNSSSEELLQTLPGIGPGMAERIVHFRETNGPFADGEDFMRVPGIGPKRYAALKEKITFE